MTRVEGENTRLRHYLARLQRKTLCYSKSIEMLKHTASGDTVRLLVHYLTANSYQMKPRLKSSQPCGAQEAPPLGFDLYLVSNCCKFWDGESPSLIHLVNQQRQKKLQLA